MESWRPDDSGVRLRSLMETVTGDGGDLKLGRDLTGQKLVCAGSRRYGVGNAAGLRLVV